MKITDLYDEVTKTGIRELESGCPIWVQPWKTNKRTSIGFLPANRATKRTYSGINIPILWAAAKQAGYVDHAWLTFKQAIELGGCLRKGEKSTHIVFTK